MPERFAARAVVALAALLLASTGCQATQSTTSPERRPVAAATPQPGSIGAIAPRTPFVIPAGRTKIHVPILMYHHIRVYTKPDELGRALSVTPRDFKAQMDYLATHGYHPIDMNDLRAYFRDGVSLPSKPVVISLDDGYRDLYTAAYPVLRSHHFKAVAYIVSGFFKSAGNATPAQVQEMDANGIEMASHTVFHVDLTTVSASNVRYEVTQSKQVLENVLGHPVLDFCYPFGRFNDQVVSAVKAAGYEDATTTASGQEHSWSDRYTWARIRVGAGEPLAAFAAALGPSEGTVAAPGQRSLPARLAATVLDAAKQLAQEAGVRFTAAQLPGNQPAQR